MECINLKAMCRLGYKWAGESYGHMFGGLCRNSIMKAD